MNLDQVDAKQKYTRENTEGMHKEREELEHRVHEIEENQESIQVELETSEQLEKELSTKLKSSKTRINKGFQPGHFCF